MPTNTETEEVQPPDWFSWTEDQVIEYLEEHGTVCSCCETVYIVRHTSTPPYEGADLTASGRTEHWVNLNIQRHRPYVLARMSHLGTVDFATDWNSEVNFERLDEFYEYICEGCYENRRDEEDALASDSQSEYIHDYGYRPRIAFFTWNETNGFSASRYPALSALGASGVRSPASFEDSHYVEQPFCGFELEMTSEGDDTVRSGAEYLHNELSSYACLKYDGSVDGGFELVTQPHTLEAYAKRDDMWYAIDQMRRRGWRSWNSNSSCGLHIHINNASFATVGHAAFFTKFIYQNREPLIRFAGRDSSYARFNYDSFVGHEVHVGYDQDGNPIYKPSTIVDVVKKRIGTDDRYLALNPRNRDTYELRFFRGNMNPKAVRACLEFTFALHEYTGTLTTTDVLARKALGWLPFLAFVRKSNMASDKYRNLYDRLTVARRNPDHGFLHTDGGEE
jgi:hypothetical protein